MKKSALAVMLAGVMVLGVQTGVWAASDRYIKSKRRGIDTSANKYFD